MYWNVIGCGCENLEIAKIPKTSVLAITRDHKFYQRLFQIESTCSKTYQRLQI